MIQVDVRRGTRAQTGVTLDDINVLHNRQNESDGLPCEGPATSGNGNVASGNGNGRSVPVPGSSVPIPGSSVAWVDMISPDESEWATLQHKFTFHPLAIEDAKQQNERAKLDEYDGYLFLSLRAWAASPVPAHKGDTPHDDLLDVTAEVDVFLGDNYIVTIHDEGLPVVAETRRRWSRHFHHEDRLGERNRPAYLLYLLLDAIVDGFFPVMDAIDVEIDTLETAIYDDDSGNDTDTLKSAIRLRKKLLLLRQTVTPLREVVNDILRTEDERLLPASLRPYWQDVYDHALRLVEQIDLHRDILGGVVDAYHAQSSNRLNQVMKTMTGVATILMSAALISGIYGMNFQFMPELTWRYGYFGALASMVGVAVLLTWYFKRIRWF
jgi:magnesium transporter